MFKRSTLYTVDSFYGGLNGFCTSIIVVQYHCILCKCFIFYGFYALDLLIQSFMHGQCDCVAHCLNKYDDDDDDDDDDGDDG